MGDMAEQNIEDGMQALIDHHTGCCEGWCPSWWCPYCEQEAKQAKKRPRTKKSPATEQTDHA